MSVDTNKSLPEIKSAACSTFQHAVELIGRKWTGVILRALLLGVVRFSDLRSAIPDLSDRMLSERLKELESEGLVQRKVIPDTPVRVEYHLTEKGRALGMVIETIGHWAQDWLEKSPVPGASETLVEQERPEA